MTHDGNGRLVRPLGEYTADYDLVSAKINFEIPSSVHLEIFPRMSLMKPVDMKFDFVVETVSNAMVTGSGVQDQTNRRCPAVSYHHHYLGLNDKASSCLLEISTFDSSETEKILKK
jgi:hypothetical protein